MSVYFNKSPYPLFIRRSPASIKKS